EDAFQAAFLVLVRKAGRIRPRGMVGNWLHGVARTTALKAKAMRTKRRAKETAAAARPKSQVPPEVRQHLEAVLDEELQALPEKSGAALVRCALEGKSIRKAARGRGAPGGPPGPRLTGGRAQLARRRARHGLPLPAGLIAAALSPVAASAGVPAALVVSTT